MTSKNLFKTGKPNRKNGKRSPKRSRTPTQLSVPEAKIAEWQKFAAISPADFLERCNAGEGGSNAPVVDSRIPAVQQSTRSKELPQTYQNQALTAEHSASAGDNEAGELVTEHENKGRKAKGKAKQDVQAFPDPKRVQRTIPPPISAIEPEYYGSEDEDTFYRRLNESNDPRETQEQDSISSRSGLLSDLESEGNEDQEIEATASTGVFLDVQSEGADAQDNRPTARTRSPSVSSEEDILVSHPIAAVSAPPNPWQLASTIKNHWNIQNLEYWEAKYGGRSDQVFTRQLDYSSSESDAERSEEMADTAEDQPVAQPDEHDSHQAVNMVDPAEVQDESQPEVRERPQSVDTVEATETRADSQLDEQESHPVEMVEMVADQPESSQPEQPELPESVGKGDNDAIAMQADLEFEVPEPPKHVDTVETAANQTNAQPEVHEPSPSVDIVETTAKQTDSEPEEREPPNSVNMVKSTATQTDPQPEVCESPTSVDLVVAAAVNTDSEDEALEPVRSVEIDDTSAAQPVSQHDECETHEFDEMVDTTAVQINSQPEVREPFEPLEPVDALEATAKPTVSETTSAPDTGVVQTSKDHPQWFDSKVQEFQSFLGDLSEQWHRREQASSAASSAHKNLQAEIFHQRFLQHQSIKAVLDFQRLQQERQKFQDLYIKRRTLEYQLDFLENGEMFNMIESATHSELNGLVKDESEMIEDLESRIKAANLKAEQKLREQQEIAEKDFDRDVALAKELGASVSDEDLDGSKVARRWKGMLDPYESSSKEGFGKF